ncbi:permease for cytosine/purines, uracil, thiamine, allantoin-domain-containing protein [Aspergillus karnatakaensis]|uniref:nucleobase cation symporter-1 family protein n=1 Tax=Aspergillus karnatakaensis TaxID=1810916 RepID=UPI003CCD5764
MTWIKRVKAAVSSKEAFLKAIETKEPERRSWGWVHFFTYYLTTSFSPTSYNLGASLASKGLQWWHTLIASVIGSVFLSIIVILNSRGATRYHVGFPVIARSSAGPRGSKFFIFVRGAVAVIFFSTNFYYGGMHMAILLRCIFGSAWDNIPNHLPADAGITSANLLAFFIYWFFQMALMFVHPVMLRHIFIVKAFYCTIALFVVLGWAIHQNGGSIGNFNFDGQVHLRGSQLVWPMISAINSVCAALCPILINQPDIARYAQKPYQATWSQTLGIFISKILIMFLSAGTTSAAQGFLGTSYWNVWDLYDAILTTYWGPGARAGIFFACFGMVLAILATNAGTNSLPAGADMAGLLPRYINIVRGQIICGLLGPLFFPWKIIANATSFLTFLSSYTVFLMPICGVMVVDYWIIRRGNLHVPSLYSREPGTPYTYYKGWNLRAIAAWVAGTAFVIHGVAGELQPELTGQSSKDMYKLSFLLSFIMGSGVYYLGWVAFPEGIYPVGWEDTPKTWEYMGDSEGFFPGESVETIRLGEGVVMGAKLDGEKEGERVVEKEMV